MGVYLRRDKKNKNYYIQFFWNKKRYRISTRARNYKLAQDILAKKRAAIAENRFLDIKNEKRISFEEMSDLFLKKYSVVYKKSFKQDVSRVNILRKFFKEKCLQDITSEMINDYVALRQNEKKKPSTINRELACLKTIFSKAIEWGYTSHNPVLQVKLFNEDDYKRERYLTKEELQRLVDVCKSPLKEMVIVAYMTGMRRGEILNLKFEDIDFSHNIIQVKNSKSGKRRFIPMNRTLANLLMEIKQKNGNSPYVFASRKGDPRKDFRCSFTEALRKANIKNFRFHDLRHTCASHLVTSGIDLLTVKELLGHSSLEMTMRYAHLSPDFKRKAVDILDGVIDVGQPKLTRFDLSSATRSATRGSHSMFDVEKILIK